MSDAQGRPFDQLTPAEVRARIEGGARLRIVDVREPLEHRIARVEGAELVPLATLPGAIGRFDADEEIVVMCHMGIRSMTACDFLVRNGFTRVRNLAGGIDRWSVEVDPSVPRY